MFSPTVSPIFAILMDTQLKAGKDRNKHPGRKCLEVSLDGVDFEDAVEALLNIEPPLKR